MSDFDEFLVNTALVETRQGVNGNGVDVFAASVTVQCFRDDSVKLTRTKTGEQVASTTALYVDLPDASSFTEGSRVTLPPDVGLPARVTTVITVALFDSAGLLPDHAEIRLE